MLRLGVVVVWLACTAGVASADAADSKRWFVAPRLGVQRIVVDDAPVDLGRRLEGAVGVRHREFELSAFYAYSKAGNSGADSRSWLGARLVVYPQRWLFAGVGFVHNWKHQGAVPTERNTFEAVAGVVLARGNGVKLDVQLTCGRFEQFPEDRSSFEFFPAVYTTHYALMLGAQF